MGRSRDSEFSDFLKWLHTVRLSRVLLVVSSVLLAATLAAYYCLTRLGPGGRDGDSGPDMADTARRVLGLVQFDHLSGPEIKARIDELIRIKNSVQVGTSDILEMNAIAQLLGKNRFKNMDCFKS